MCMPPLQARVRPHPGLARLPQNRHFPGEPAAQPLAFHIQVVRRLQVQPEPIRGAKEPRQP